jgi:hypothetical protein
MVWAFVGRVEVENPYAGKLEQFALITVDLAELHSVFWRLNTYHQIIEE